MKGIPFLGETPGSHLICSSCRRRIAIDRDSNGGLFRSFIRAPIQFSRAFASDAKSPGLPTGIKTSLWRLQRADRFKMYSPNRASQLGAISLNILENKVADADNQGQDEATTTASLHKILQGRQPEQVMNALLDPQYRHVIESLSRSAFVEAFHLLSPSYFIEPYRQIHRPLHPLTVEIRGYKPLERIFAEFSVSLAQIVGIRRAAGHTLSSAEYSHLLHCAASMGDARMAENIWEDMKSDGVDPDVRCYNFYLEACIWDNSYVGTEKYHLRVSPFSYRKRRFDTPPQGWEGYGTAGRSVRKRALEIFKDMTARGVDGNETTFVNIFLASSRVGHTRGMKNILKTVWNIDIDLLVTMTDERSLALVTPYESSSALYPTSRLLFAVAHGFGINNDMAAAMRSVDFISRKYRISVPDHVWLELFERAFVLAKRRFGPDRERDLKGQVPWDFVTGIFDMMTSEPYNVSPRMETYRGLAKAAWDRNRLRDFKGWMNAAYTLLEETRQKRKRARRVLEQFLDQPFEAASDRKFSVSHSVLESKAFVDSVNRYELLRLLVAQQTAIMERLVRLLLIHHRWVGRDNPEWERCLLPNAIQEWQDFLPRSFYYNTTGGAVTFHGKTSWKSVHLRPHNKVPVRRPPEDQAANSKEASEIDDDFLWQKFRPSLDEHVANMHPLRQLFWDTSRIGTVLDEATSPGQDPIQTSKTEAQSEDTIHESDFVPAHPDIYLPDPIPRSSF